MGSPRENYDSANVALSEANTKAFRAYIAYQDAHAQVYKTSTLWATCVAYPEKVTAEREAYSSREEAREEVSRCRAKMDAAYDALNSPTKQPIL